MLTRERMALLIKATLDEQGIKQAEFARRAGVTEKHISRTMTGAQFASMEQLDYWAFVLGYQWHIELQPLGQETT